MIESKCVRCGRPLVLMHVNNVALGLKDTAVWVALEVIRNSVRDPVTTRATNLCNGENVPHVPHPLTAFSAVNDLVAIRDQLEQPEGPASRDAENREVNE